MKPTHPTTARRPDPPLAGRFLVEIDGVASASFEACTGLSWRVRVDRFTEGGCNDAEVSLIGPARYEPLVLRRGLCPADGAFAAWVREQTDPRVPIEPRSIAVVVLGDDGSERARYVLHAAWCSAYRGPQFDANRGAVAVEEVELTYTSFDYEPATAPPPGSVPMDDTGLPPGVSS